jgi:hypothetical protein
MIGRHMCVRGPASWPWRVQGSIVRQRRKARLRALLCGASLVLVASTNVRAFPQSLPTQPSLYVIEGYLDRAPPGAEIADRIDIEARGRRRALLVASYGTPGEPMLDRYLSRSMAEPYSLQGTDEEISRVIDAAPGTKISGTFAAYPGGPPWLLIADLTSPATNPHGGSGGS